MEPDSLNYLVLGVVTGGIAFIVGYLLGFMQGQRKGIDDLVLHQRFEAEQRKYQRESNERCAGVKDWIPPSAKKASTKKKSAPKKKVAKKRG